MSLNLKTVSISLVIVLIALFVLFYTLENIIRLMGKSGTLPMIILLFVMVAGALALVLNITVDMLS